MSTDTPRTDAQVRKENPIGEPGNTAVIATDFARQLERELTAWETELSKVMPPDYKDWWQNDKREWPLVARLVIEGKNRHAELDAAAYDKLERELAAERALADRLGNWMQEHRKAWQWQNVDPDCDCEDCVFLVPFDEALAAWKEARHGTV